MPAEDLLVTFTTASRVSHVFQAVADVENAKNYEITTEPGVIERVGARFARRFAMMLTVSDDIQNLPAVTASGEDLTKNRNARQQYALLESLAGQNVTIDARAVADSTAVYTIEGVRAIDSLKSENTFQVQVTCTEDLSGKLKGGGLATLRLGRIRIPLKPEPLATSSANLGDGANTCTILVPVKHREAKGWVKAVGGFFADIGEGVVDSLVAVGDAVVEVGKAVATGFKIGVGAIADAASATGTFVANLFTDEVTTMEERTGTVIDGMCVVGDGGQ